MHKGAEPAPAISAACLLLLHHLKLAEYLQYYPKNTEEKDIWSETPCDLKGEGVWDCRLVETVRRGCNLTSTQVTSDPQCQRKVMWGAFGWSGSRWRWKVWRYEWEGGGGIKGGTRALLRWALTQSPIGWRCLRNCQSHGKAAPEGLRPPGRWENNSSFCQSFKGRGSDGHHWELESGFGTRPILDFNTGGADKHQKTPVKPSVSMLEFVYYWGLLSSIAHKLNNQ